MSVYKDERGLGTWFVVTRYQDWTGKRRQHKKRGFATKREAVEYERDFLSKQACSGLTVKQLYDLYIKDCEHRLRPTSVVSTKRHFMRLLPHIQDLELKAVTPRVIRNLQFKLIDGKFSPTTIRVTMTALSTMLNYAVKYYNLPSNPCHTAGSVQKYVKPEMNIWTEEEFKRFLDTRKPRHRVLFSVLFYTGMRVGELLALTWADIDGNVLHITKTYDSTRRCFAPPKTASSVRDIPIPPFLVNMLATRPYDYLSSDRVFPVGVSSVEQALRTGARRAGLQPIRVHDLRHSHASMLISLKVPIPSISRRLGHSNPNVTMAVYAHSYDEDEKSIANILENGYKKEAAQNEPPGKNYEQIQGVSQP